MKKRTIALLLTTALLSCGGLTTLTSCSHEGGGDVVVTAISFEKTSYDVHNGDCVTVKGAPAGVKYRLKDKIEGVTLDENSGKFTFDEKRLSYPDGILIASYEGLDPITTIVRFITSPDLPEVSITNISNYLVNGEKVMANAILKDSDEQLAVEYHLKNHVPGVSIDAESGQVEYLPSVKDGTAFTVIATSRTISDERTFYALIDNIVLADTAKFVVEKNNPKDAVFKIDYNGNTGGDADTTASNAAVMHNGKTLDKKYFSYDATSKEVTIKKEYIATLTTGEDVLFFVSKRNNVPLHITVADEVIYEASQIKDIFGLDYTDYIKNYQSAPIFNKGSLEGYYVLGDDIDLNELYATDVHMSKYGMVPIGYTAEGENGPLFAIPFAGTFDGNGHTVSNLRYTHNDQHFWGAGLFGFNTGTIKNFTITGHIDEIRGWTGVVCGRNNGIIENIIVDVNLPVAVETSYSAIVSVNNGTMKNIISLNTDISVQRSKNNGGYIVGWNGTGTMENFFAVKSLAKTKEITDDFGSPIEVGAPKALYGRDDSIDKPNPGVIFENLDELKAYDFASVLPRQFDIDETGMPHLVVEHSFDDVAKFEVSMDKDFALKGQTIALDYKILPTALADKLIPLITYEIPEGKGIVINDGILDLANLNVKPEGEEIKITAKVEYNGKSLTSSFAFMAYPGITEYKFASLPDNVLTGETYSVDVISKQLDKFDDVKYTVTTKDNLPTWQKKFVLEQYSHIDNIKRTITFDEYLAFTGVTNLTITAQTGSLKTSKDITINKVGVLPGGVNSSLKYKDDVTDFSLPCEGLTITEVLFDNTLLEASKYSVTDGKLVIKRDVVIDKEIMHDIIVKANDNKLYKGYIGATEEVAHDEAWIKANDANLVHIKNADDFKNYFVTNALVDGNNAKSYVLDNDIDLTALENVKTPYTDEANFTGNIYGNGHKIMNYKLHHASYNWASGLFEFFNGGIYDVIFDNIDISSVAGAAIGIIGVASGPSKTILRNVHAINCDMLLGDTNSFFNAGFIGGLIGHYWNSDAELVAKQCMFSTFAGYNSHVANKHP